MGQLIVEVVLFRDNFDTEFYALQIRRLAARYQSGEDISKIKNLVDGVITSMDAILKYEDDFQLKKWSELFKKLDVYMSKFSDPDWMTVIFYARRQISRKKSAAKARCKNIYTAT